MKLAVTAAAAALATGRPAAATPPRADALPRQDLPAPFYGQHTGVVAVDLNADGAIDLLFAAGRHWIDQPYALLNLGPELDASGTLSGVRFSDALPLGPPGGYYQVDVVDGDDASATSTVLLVGGTCHVEKPNDFGSCARGTNTSATVLEVVVDLGGCSVARPEAECHLTWRQVWSHPQPRGDRNGGFADLGRDSGRGGPSVVLLGQGGVEIFDPPAGGGASYGDTPAYRVAPPAKTDPRSDFARYAAFAAGRLPVLGGVVAAGRRSDYDRPARDAAGKLVGLNLLVHEDAASEEFATMLIDPLISGEPYPGNQDYSIQTTNFAFADIDGDGINDLLEGTYLQGNGSKTLVVEGYPLPQRIHFFGDDGEVRSTSVVLEYEHGETGRAVATGQIFPDSTLPDVVFASSSGTVDVFANLGRDAAAAHRGLELRHTVRVGRGDCMLRNLAVAPLARTPNGSDACWIGIVCALTCGLERREGRNEIVFVESRGPPCGNASPRLDMHAKTKAKAA